MFARMNQPPTSARSKPAIRSAWSIVFGVILACGLFLAGMGLPLSTVAANMVCPFCSAVKQTLTEEMLTTDAVVFAEVLGPAKPTNATGDLPTLDLMMNLKITKVIKGDKLVTAGKQFTTVVPPSFAAGQECLVMGVITDQLSWSTPVKMTERSREYILDLQQLPDQGPKRLKFFLQYLEDPETLLAYDAYDEFARAPYADVKAIKGDMDREQLLKWITDSEVTINRKRLYYTMLGVCGTDADLPLLEKLITSADKRERAALDALSACYLTLAGEKGVKLIEEQFLSNKEAEYVDTYAAVAALRFHGTESDIIPVPRILKAMRLLLDRPDIADLVIPDLARWKDWSVMDKLVQMFKDADDDSKWVRVPIVNYLRTCPLPEAEAKIEELKKVDPQSVRRALMFFEVESGLEDDSMDDDFDKQLDELEKENKDNDDGGEASASLQSVSHRQVVRRPVLDGDQALANDPYAQPIASSYTESDAAVQIAPFEATDEELAREESKIQPVANESSAGTVLIPVPDSPAEVASSPVERKEVAQQPAEVLSAGSDPSDRRTASVRRNSDLSPSVGQRLQGSYMVWLITVPVLVNAVLLVLAWSIFNGTFSRLFC